MKTFEEQKAFVGKLNIMDDAFFQKVMENPQASEEMLQIILQKPGLRVVELQTQRFLRIRNCRRCTSFFCQSMISSGRKEPSITLTG